MAWLAASRAALAGPVAGAAMAAALTLALLLMPEGRTFIYFTF